MSDTKKRLDDLERKFEIMREDLLDFLAGKPWHPHNRTMTMQPDLGKCVLRERVAYVEAKNKRLEDAIDDVERMCKEEVDAQDSASMLAQALLVAIDEKRHA